LACAGVVVAVLLWCGPMSRAVRAGGRRVTGALLRPSASTYLVVLCVYAAALMMLLAVEVVGPAYSPLPPPPWEGPLRDLL
jgi:hypothetical protein